MNLALVILAAMLGFAATGSGIAKLVKVPKIIESMTHVGVKPAQLPILATLEFLGTLGLIIGIWVQPLGVLSAVCLALYFLGATLAHVRVKGQPADLAPAVVLMLIAVAVTVLQIGR